MNDKINTIFNVLADAYQISVNEILSSSRFIGHSRPRQMGYWLTEQLTDMSHAEIMAHFYRSCPATIMIGIQRVTDRRDDTPSYKYASNQRLKACTVKRDFETDPISLIDLGLHPRIKKNRSHETTKPESERRHVEKPRKCLMHGGQFISSHIGERVCPSCKDTSVWRSGAA